MKTNLEEIRTVVCSEAAEGRDQLGGVMTELSGMMVIIFYILIGVLVPQVYAFVKTHIVHLKLVHFIVYRFSSKETTMQMFNLMIFMLKYLEGSRLLFAVYFET